MGDKAALARQRQMRKEIEARKVKLARSGAVMSKDEARLRKKQERQAAIASKGEAAAVRQEFADKVARRKALEAEDKAKFDAARGPPPKTLIGEIGDWYSEVVAKQVDYATHKVQAARAAKRREQEEARRLARPDGQPARYHWTHPSPLLLNKLARVMDTHTIPESTAESAAWATTATTLVAAARQGDVAAVVRMLAGEGPAKTTGELALRPNGKAGVEVLRPDAEGISPVMWAAWKGHAEIVRLLLDGKADIFAASHTGAFPLFMAAQEGHMECMRTLMEASADVHQRRNDYATALHGAVKNRQTEAVRVLLQAGAAVDERSESYDTTLLVAVLTGHLPCIRLLLEHKADVEAENAQGQFPLSVAVHRGDLSCIDVLAEHGADVNRPVVAVAGASPLASRGGGGSSGGGGGGGGGGTCGVHVAVLRGAVDVLFELLELKASPDARNHAGATPLWIAAQRNAAECAQLLVECGADVNLANHRGATPVYVGCQEGSRDALHVLFAAGADVNIARQDGVTPERVARQCGNQGLLRALKHLHKPEKKKWTLPVL